MPVLYTNGGSIMVDDTDSETESHVLMEDSDNWVPVPWTLASVATESPSAASKSLPSRVVVSMSRDGFSAPYLYVGMDENEKVDVGVRNSVLTRYNALSGSSASVGAHVVGMTFDGSDIAAVLDGTEGPGTTVSGDVSGLDITVLGALIQGAIGNVFDYSVGPVAIYDRQLTSAERDAFQHWMRYQGHDVP